MTNANTPSGNEDLTDTAKTPATDAVPGEHGTADEQSGTDAGQNPPLPDWGPTDGEHGVDGDTEA